MARELFVIDETQIGQAERLAGVGLNNDQLAGYFGCSPATWDEVLKRQPDVKQAIERGRAKAIGSVASSLYQQATMKGNVTAQIFFLKTRARWREAERADDASESAPTIQIGYNPNKRGAPSDERRDEGRDDGRDGRGADEERPEGGAPPGGAGADADERGRAAG